MTEEIVLYEVGPDDICLDKRPGLLTWSCVWYGQMWEDWMPNNHIIIFAGLPPEKYN